MEDHNGDKIFKFRLVPTWELLEDKGKAVVLEFHTIETNYGPIKIRPFCIISYRDNKFISTHSKGKFLFEFNIGDISINAKQSYSIGVSSRQREEDPPIVITSNEKRYKEAYNFMGQELYIEQFVLNDGLYKGITSVKYFTKDSDEIFFYRNQTTV